MAKKRGLQNSSSTTTRTFGKGMIKDLNNSLLPEGAYIHARNAVNNSKLGDMGVIENESSNLYCNKAPYTVIGSIHIYKDKWAIFSTDDTNSEIGYFEEDTCTYKTIVNDSCLNFKKSNLIIGVSKENFKCGRVIYWADGLNPDRYMSIDNPPYIQIPDPNNTDVSCDVTINTNNLDCEKLRIAKLTDFPCINIKPAGYGGELLNGTYQVVMAYQENGIRVTDYSKASNILSLFDHSNVNGNIEIELTNLDKRYDYFELVLVSFVNNKLVAHSIGEYSTNFSTISIDKIPSDAITVPLAFLSLMLPSYEKSDGIYRNGEYLLRVAPTTKFEFNYQPLANQIESEYVVVEYDKKYYREAGKNVGYMRDEVYPFFIRWIYNTGEKTYSFHIPGRSLTPSELTNTPSPVYGGIEYLFENTNTAGTLISDSGTTDDGGIIVGKGLMAGWQSTEKYPDDKPEIWADLCGEYIRHHKFPDNLKTNHYKQGGSKINVLGIRFKNIPFPLDNYGNPIPGIIGYEILRGDREGNKTVLAKGLINNMGSYKNDDQEDVIYQNYPYNDIRLDPFLSKTFIKKDNETDTPLGGPLYFNNYNSFHSPDTQFKHPFLSAKELKIYNNPYGETEGVFNIPEKHPKFKIINNAAFFVSILVGLGLSFKDLKGKEKAVVGNVTNNDSVFIGVAGTNGLSSAANLPLIGAVNLALADVGAGYVSGVESLASLGGLAGSSKVSTITTNTAVATALVAPGVSGTRLYEYDPVGSGLPGPLKITNSLTSFLAFWGQHTDDFLNIIKNFSKFHNYIVSYQSHGFYNNYAQENKNGIRINRSSYIKDKIHEFGSTKINNLFRNGFIALELNNPTGFPTTQDDSRNLMSQITSYSGPQGVNEDNFGKYFKQGKASSFYGALKQRLRNQYGQLNNIKQIPASDCFKVWETDIYNPPNATSDVIFGGDTYIGRYTEKNTFFYFFDWLFDSPDDFEYDYLLRKMLPYPTYWMNTLHYQTNDFFNGLFDWMCAGSGSVGGSADTSGVLPRSFHNFDKGTDTNETTNTNNGLCTPINLVVKNAVMYLFNSGVKDFFVESEINVEYRDWGSREDQRHYDPYNHIDYASLFKTSIIKDMNYFKYDYSLSVSRFYQAHSPYGAIRNNTYDPTIAETCYSYYKRRVIYSLPNTKESSQDNWLVYLVDNKKDFTSEISSIKPIGKTGALILFKNESPVQFQGVDTLVTDSGTKITIGDGGLFNSNGALQSVVNTDVSYEYASCQNRLSVINTPAGLFWISQNQGKIFQYTGQLEEISQNGMKWWFEEFLPYQLIKQFPDFKLTDNTVIGIGTQSIYDNDNSILYVSKRDYVVKERYLKDVIYLNKDLFSIKGALIRLGDPKYFENTSWTVSYDVKTKSWVSFHDWHPNFMLPSKNSFMTIKNNSIWKHNVRCDSYCNFYNINYPFEIELVTPTGQNVNTLKSIEYLMEVYKWDNNCVDRNHILDFNFDRAYIYNTEQVSGELRLNLKPKNNAPEILSYPRVNNSNIDILYSKEEHKYRFNQFWDITDDRGEFSLAKRMIWNTDINGYTKSLNKNNLNYQKSPLDRKKFRHYESVLLLKRLISGNYNMQLKLINSKTQYSSR